MILLLNINATRGPTDCCSATHGLLLSEDTGLRNAGSIICNRDAASRRGLSRVGYFITLNGSLNGHPPSLHYKRRDPYIFSAKAPVLEGSGSRRLYRRKGTSVDHVYVVFGACVYLGFFYYSSKTDSW